MSLPNTVLSNAVLEVVAPRPLVQDGILAARPRSQSKPSLPSRIAVVGNYLPRQCGIATFTTDLCAAISAEYGTARLLALPVNDTEQGYDYPARVRWSLAQDDVKSYQEAAEFLNFNNIDMVCLQHEYGIFGGPAGSHILHLLRGLKIGDRFNVTVPAFSGKSIPVKVTVINVQGQYATWRATRATGDFDLRTFEVRAVPVEPFDCRLDETLRCVPDAICTPAFGWSSGVSLAGCAAARSSLPLPPSCRLP